MTATERTAHALQVEMAEQTARRKAEKALDTLDKFEAAMKQADLWGDQLWQDAAIFHQPRVAQLQAMVSQTLKLIEWTKGEIGQDLEPVVIRIAD